MPCLFFAIFHIPQEYIIRFADIIREAYIIHHYSKIDHAIENEE